MESLRETTDTAMMARCIELSRIAVTKGEYPFGTVGYNAEAANASWATVLDFLK